MCRYAQDQRKPTPTFWTLWQAIVDRVLDAFRQNTDFAKNRALPKLLGKVFLNVNWKLESRDWPPLQGEAHRIEAMVNFFAPHPTIIEHYLSFLRRIGSKQLLPAALLPVAGKVAARPADEILTPRSVKYLEEILGRFIYSDPRKIKATPEMRAAVMMLLNGCIAIGSSVCYRQRDDFLTPG